VFKNCIHMKHKHMHSFISDLHQFHCLKSHLHERVVDLVQHTSFTKVRRHLEKLLITTAQQLSYIDILYDLLNEKSSFNDLDLLIDDIELLYDKISNEIHVPELAHNFLCDYIGKIQSAELVLHSFLHAGAIRERIPGLDFSIFSKLQGDSSLFEVNLKKCYPRSFDSYSILLQRHRHSGN